MKSTIKKILVAAALFLSASPGAKAGLDEVVNAYLNRGWLIHDIEASFLAEDESANLFVYLDAGDRMVVRGEGAEDVRDLDIAVVLPNGNLLKKDEDFDATPCVMFVAPVSGLYRIEMKVIELWSGLGGAEVALVLAER